LNSRSIDFLLFVVGAVKGQTVASKATFGAPKHGAERREKIRSGWQNHAGLC